MSHVDYCEMGISKNDAKGEEETCYFIEFFHRVQEP